MIKSISVGQSEGFTFQLSEFTFSLSLYLSDPEALFCCRIVEVLFTSLDMDTEMCGAKRLDRS